MNVVPADPPGRAGQGELMDRAGRPATDDSTATDASTPTDGSTATGESPADNSPARDDGARPASSPADDSPAGDDGARPAGRPADTSAGAGDGRRRARPWAARRPAPGAAGLLPGRGNRGDLAACAAAGPGAAAGDPDVASYVWDLWWVPHQVFRLDNPWFTTHMAAPVGIQLGYDTTMPLVGMIMSPVTLAVRPGGLVQPADHRHARPAVLRDVPGRPAVAALAGRRDRGRRLFRPVLDAGRARLGAPQHRGRHLVPAHDRGGRRPAAPRSGPPPGHHPGAGPRRQLSWSTRNPRYWRLSSPPC